MPDRIPSDVPELVDLEQLIEAAQELEPLPRSLSLLLAAGTADTPDVETICDVVAMDPPLAAKVLRRANSAMGSRHRVARTREAVVLLGSASVVSLALGDRVRHNLSQELPEYGLAAGVLWEHSVRASMAADAIRSLSGRSVPVAAVSAALLHDLGKIVMARFLTPGVMQLIREAMDGGATRLDAERELLQVHHGELGALVAQHWGLPDDLVSAIAYHHNPFEVDEPGADTVFLADAIADKTMGRVGDSPATDEAIAASCERLALSAMSLQRVEGRVTGEFEVISGF